MEFSGSEQPVFSDGYGTGTRSFSSSNQFRTMLIWGGTVRLGSYRAAHREVMPLVTHDTDRYANDRAEVSHQPTRQRERQMRRSKSPDQAQMFLHVHGVIQNLFRVGRHRLKAARYRLLRSRSFGTWQAVTAA